MSPAEKKQMIKRDHPGLSIARQCNLVKLSRSAFYYRPAGVDAETLDLMKAIDQAFMAFPFFGSGRIAALLCRQGVAAGRHRIRGFFCLPCASNSADGHFLVYWYHCLAPRRACGEVLCSPDFDLRVHPVEVDVQFWSSIVKYVLFFIVLTACISPSKVRAENEFSANQLAQIYFEYSEQLKTPGWWEGLTDSERNFYNLIVTSMGAAYYSAWIHHLNSLPDEKKENPICDPDNSVSLEDVPRNTMNWAMRAILNPHTPSNAVESPLPVVLGQAGESAFRETLARCEQ